MRYFHEARSRTSPAFRALRVAIVSFATLAAACTAPAGPSPEPASGPESVGSLSQAFTQTPANLPATSLTLDVTLPPLSAADRGDLVLAARTSLSLDDRGQTSGALASAGTLTTGTDANLGNATSTGNLTLGARTHAGALSTGGTATLGASSSDTSLAQHAALAAQSAIHDTVTIPAAAVNVSLAPNEVASLPTGSYGQLTLNAGATLTLSAGTYFVRGLDVEPQAKLSVSAPVTLYVVSSLVFRGTVSDGGDATRLKLFYAGSGAVQLGAPTRGLWVAPNASVIGIAGGYAGFLYASSLELSPGSSIAPVASPLALLAPPLTGMGATFSATQDIAFSGTVATFTDANTADTASRFAATIAWGDGSTSSGTVTGTVGTFSVAGTHTYSSAGTFHVTVTLADSVTGITGSAASTAHVGAELAVSGVAISATQGVSFTSTVAKVTDVNATDTASAFAAGIAWGDGSTSAGTIAGSAGSFTVSGTHTYATPGMFTVTTTITDSRGGATATATAIATVIPGLTAAGVDVSVTQGVAFTGAVASFVDTVATDAASIFTAVVSWGDGTTSPGVVTGASGSFAVAGTHTYAQAGTFTVTVTITDAADGASATATSTATVAAQLTAAGAPFDASQGVATTPVLAIVTDQNTDDVASGFTATIQWGDGTSDASPSPDVFIVAGGSAGTFEIGGAHTYATTGSFTVTVTVVDTTDGATVTTTAVATVAPALVLTGIPFTASQGVAIGPVVATLADPNTGDSASSFGATVDWGDGTSDASPSSNVFVLAGGGAGSLEIGGLHTYVASGTFTVTVTVTDASNGATVTTTTTASVSSSLSLVATPFSASPGTIFGGLVANLNDANTSATASDVGASIDWGDGTVDGAGSPNVFVVPGGSAGAFEIGGIHTYAASGTVTVTVSVTDAADGATASTSFSVDVM